MRHSFGCKLLFTTIECVHIISDDAFFDFEYSCYFSLKVFNYINKPAFCKPLDAFQGENSIELLVIRNTWMERDDF